MTPEQVEIKISLGAAEVDAACDRFELSKDEARKGEIWFCESLRPEGDGFALDLLDEGWIVRLRRREGDADDVTVKLRRPEPMVLPDGWAQGDSHSEFKVEGDWTGANRQVSASVVAEVDGHLIEEAASGPPLAAELFSVAQRQFVAVVGTSAAIDLSSLQPLGPIDARRWTNVPSPDFDESVVAERWSVDDLRFLELSIRVPHGRASYWQRAFGSWVTGHGFDPDATQVTKTRLVLEHFAARLAR